MFGLSSGLKSYWFIAVMSAASVASGEAAQYPTEQVAGHSSVVLASFLVVGLKNWKPTVLFPG